MIKEKYKPYPKYKASGIEWIGEIPEGWKERRFCFLFSFTKGLSITKEDLMDEGIPCVNYGEIHSKYGFEVDPKKHDLKCVKTDYLKSNPNSILKHGDFVFADTSEDIEGSGNFTYLNSKEITFAGYHTIITKPKNDFDFRYTAFLFDSVPFRTQIRSEVSGIKVYSITKTILKDTIVLLPPIPEQRIIADFLEHETARIDGVVAKQTRMIELLKEKRAALITQAVTKGLDPKAKMKHSGVEWIGEIPEEWDVRKLKWLIAARLKYGANEIAELDDPNLPRYIRITDFEDSGDIRDETFKSLPHEKAEGYFLSEGDILFARSGATVGKTFQFKNYKGKACFAGYLIKATPKAGFLNSDFLSYFTKSNSYESWKDATFIKSTIENISADKYQVLQVPHPPLPEQQAIADFLDHETAKIDTMIGKIEKQIVLLNEYKQSLITHAVTGKIDIRGEMNAQNN